MCCPSVVALNTKACCLMNIRQFREAAAVLVSALQQIESIQTCASQSAVGVKVDMEGLIQPIRIAASDDDRSFVNVYNWALVVVANDDGVRAIANHEARLTAILLYNLGFCYQAESRGPTNERFCKAIKMYDAAIMILDSSGCHERLLRLAILNNQAYILTSFHDYSAAQDCLKALEILLARTSLCEEVAREDILEIHLNVALVRGAHAHSAAA
jgi:hypothetical protein